MNASRGSGPGRRPQQAALALAAGAGFAILVLYLAHPAIQGFRFPIGPDGPVYTWLARLAGEVGLADAPGGGPGVPVLAAVLARMLGVEVVDAVMLLGPMLAAACGLAAGGVLEATLGPDRGRTAAAAVMTGAFTAYLAGGWLANVAMVAIFLAAVAVLARSASSSRSVLAGAALLAAAAMAHRVFALIGSAILLVAAGWRLASSRRSGSQGGSAGLRLAVAAVGGPAAGLLLAAIVARGPEIPGDTSQDGFFRRVGLRALLLDRYRERFLGDVARASIPMVSGLALAAPWTLERGDQGDRYLRELLSAWAAVTAVGIVVLAATGLGPPYRIVQFAFFLPVAAAVGGAMLMRRSRLRAAGAAALGLAFVAFSMVGWFRQAPAFTRDELASVRRAGAALAPVADGTPLVFVVDTDEGAAAYHVTRAANVIRAALPTERIDDVRVVVGEPADALAGQPTLTGDAEHDRISTVYMREATPLLDEAVILVVRDFNEIGFSAASGTVVADGVLALTRAGKLRGVPAGEVSAPDGLGTELWLLAPAGLVVLGLLGWGWSRWAMRPAGPTAVAMLAPSAGVAIAIVAGVFADAIELTASSPGALALVGAAALLGYVLAVRDTR